MNAPRVRAFYHQPSGTLTYLVVDPLSRAAAIVDPVLDYDAETGTSHASSARAVLDAVRAAGLELQWILETHVHADHLSAAWFVKERTGAMIGAGAGFRLVQDSIANTAGAAKVAAFDRFFGDGEELIVGNLRGSVLATPGHTPSCVTYVFGDAAFVGDALFMPDIGTGRCDFPGGSPSSLFQSIRRILALPDRTRLYSAHDYATQSRAAPEFGVTVAEQKRTNVHVREGATEEKFVALREARDAELPLPALFDISLRSNIGGGHLPPP